MKPEGVRYTIATDEEVENLAPKWTLENGDLKLKGISGYLETNIVLPMPSQFDEVTNGTKFVRVIYRYSEDLGDLFLLDTSLGLTVEVQQKSSKKAGSGSQILKLLNQRLALSIRSDSELSNFVDVRGTQILHQNSGFLSSFEELFLSVIFPSVRSWWLEKGLIEFTIDPEESKIQLRTVSRLPTDFSLTKVGAFKTEVGIVQRQGRHLQDAEYKGLSTFLPGVDMSKYETLSDALSDSPDPFMIFFDKRLESHVAKPHGSYETSIEGTGSHLSFTTIVKRSQLAKKISKCSLYAEYHLPKGYFFDVYELEEVFPEKFQIFGEQDLEKPIWQIKAWGSILYLELESLTDLSSTSVPFHTRYFDPTYGGYYATEIPLPTVFAACPRPDPSFSDNPWDSFTIKQRVFGKETSFEYLQNNGSSKLDAHPALADAGVEDLTTAITLLTIGIGFLYVLYKIVTAPARRIPIVDAQRQAKHSKAE